MFGDTKRFIKVKVYSLMVRFIALLCIASVFMGVFSPLAVKAAESKKITMQFYDYSTKETVNYTSTPVKFLCNNYTLDINTPGILDNGTALGPYDDIFVDYYGVKATLSDSKLTLTYNGTTIKMTLNSKTAYVNGKKKTLSTVPRKVKYADTGITKVLVPTRFVSESFGFTYAWKSNLYTVSITKNIDMVIDGDKVTYNGLLGKAALDGKNIALNKAAPVMIMDSNAMAPAYKVFKKGLGCSYVYNEVNETVTISKGNITVKFDLGSTTAYINKEAVECPVAPRLVYFNETGETNVIVPAYFTAKALGFDYEWDGDIKTISFKTTDATGEYEKTAYYGYKTADEKKQVLTEYSTENSRYYYEAHSDYATADDYTKINTNSIMTNNFEITGGVWINNIYRSNTANQRIEQYCINLSGTGGNVEVLGFNENNQLVITIDNVLCSDRIYQLAGNYVGNIETSTGESVISTIKFDFSSIYNNYDVRYDSSGTVLYVTVFRNYLTDISYGVNQYGIEHIRIKSLCPIDAEILEDTDNLSIIIADTINAIGNKNTYFNNSYFASISINDNETDSIISINGFDSEIYDIHFELMDNELVIYFSQKPSAATELCNISRRYVYIPLPDEMTVQNISSEDRYYNKQIVVKLPGNYTDFYSNNRIENFSDVISNTEVIYKDGSTVIIFTTETIQTFKFEEAVNGCRLIMNKPSDIFDKIVLLDAGHGGTDPGAINNGYQEKNINFMILNNLLPEYFKDSDIKFYYTRVDDTLVNLYDRAAMADEIGADFFISLHMNANNSSKVNGTGVYYCTTNNDVSATDFSSEMLAATLSENLSKTLGTENDGALTANFVVISANTVPAVLIELGYLTNSSDRKKITNLSKQKAAAKTIYDTICDMYDLYFVE